MRYVIVGAGAVGGAIGGALATADRNVVLVARGPHGRAIRDRGLTVRSPGGEVTRRIECHLDPAEVRYGDDDVVVLAVKSHQVAEAIAPIAAVAPGVAVACAQNGVVAERTVGERFARVYGIMSWIPAMHLEPGVVEVYAQAPAGAFRVGLASGGDDELAVRMAADLTAAGFDAAAVSDIMPIKRAKLLNNLGNALDAFCVRDRGLRDIADRAQAEGAEVLRAAGLPFVPADALFDDMRARLDHLATIDGQRRAGGSTWQSVTRGLETEVAHLNGWIADLGRAHGVATPVNDALARLPAEASGPRSIALAQLVEWIDG